MKRVIEVKVKTNSPEPKIVEKDGKITVYVKAMPEGNKANMEIIKLFSKKYKDVRILRGLKSSKKLLGLEI